MTGTIIQVSLSLGGLPKRPVGGGFLGPLGLEGDRYAHPHIHGGPDKAVLIIDAEGIDELAAAGYPVFYGALGENLTTRGLDRRQFRIGQRLRAGGAVLEVTRIRVPCATLDVYGPAIQQEIYDLRVQAGDAESPRWARSGVYARVLVPGPVHTDDIIMLVDTPA